MPLKTPPLKERPEVIADWVEIRTAADSSGSFRISTLKRFWDTQRDQEGADSEGKHQEEEDTDEDGVSGGDEDKFLSAITDEIGERSEHLGASYPFQFTHGGLRLALKEDLCLGAWTYLFCLFFQHRTAGEIFTGQWLPDITNPVRDLFQVCSTLAAAGKVQGCAISFGWPRPEDNPPFLEKLHQVYRLFGEGVPRDAALPGASPMVKDEEIDVIAWKPRADRTPGTIYLLGQVASGDNWVGKSIKGGSIDFFHNVWFSVRPPSSPLPAIFIPHAVPPMGEGNRRDRVGLLTEKFGMIFDRMVLPSLTDSGYLLSKEGRAEIHVERVDEAQNVIEWVNAQLTGLRAAGPAPL